MNSVRWAEIVSERDIDVERICQAALDRAPAERPALLAEECGSDEALRRDVESLLALEAAADRFIETTIDTKS